MLRKDVKYMLDKDWEPKVPDLEIIREQASKFDGRLSGSVRLAKGLVDTYGYRKIGHKKRSRLQRNIATK